MSLPAGVESIDVYVEVDSADIDGKGTPGRVPADDPVSVDGCWVYPISVEEAVALGQTTETIYCIVAAAFPGGAWSRVTWNGRDWDAVGEPREFRSGFTGTELAQIYIRARGPRPL